jgi:hypothetical protein
LALSLFVPCSSSVTPSIVCSWNRPPDSLVSNRRALLSPPPAPMNRSHWMIQFSGTVSNSPNWPLNAVKVNSWSRSAWGKLRL